MAGTIIGLDQEYVQKLTHDSSKLVELEVKLYELATCIDRGYKKLGKVLDKSDDEGEKAVVKLQMREISAIASLMEQKFNITVLT